TGDHLTIDVLRYPGSTLRPGDPDGARSSVLPSVINHLQNGGLLLLALPYCVLLVMRTAQ
ncbi:hypothetical protein, partial [Streptomyces sp. NPDC000188]|uniref:hypothetical protein n=1 Tax=Streptomyces sp. NPDC000188 TaxID=3154245 RepID=UPI00331D7B7B